MTPSILLNTKTTSSFGLILGFILLIVTEFADVIIINKIDLVSEKTLNTVDALVRRLNPVAKVFKTSYSKMPQLNSILNSNSFSFMKAATAPGWLKTLRGEVNSIFPLPIIQFPLLKRSWFSISWNIQQLLAQCSSHL